ncbi:MAG: YkgJ family cysteine cluster protein [Thermodesulfobacteriota bacterium]
MTRDDISAALDRLYQIYEDRVSAGVPAVCRPGCCTCCTRNVILTSLEGYRLISYLSRIGRPELLQKVRAEAGRGRFIPSLTTNQIAALCAGGMEIPEESMDSSHGSCPLLEDGLCTVYPARPFGCRCMLSLSSCEEKGFAEVDDYLLTVNQVFLQTIEHLDAGGYTANLTDMLLHLSRRAEGSAGDLAGRVANMPIPVLMIPPEHRERIRPILEAIYSIRVGD